MLGLIKTDMKNLADIAPLIDYDIIEKFKDKYKDSEGHFATNTANICNGLTPVVINRTEVGANPPENRVVSINPPTEINSSGLVGDILKQDEVVVDVPVDDEGMM
jgi:hypothetical protein